MNKELKEICSKCEDYIHCQGKGCAWRSLGNEYCDEVENVNKLINDSQQEIDHQKKIIDRLSRKIQKRNKELTKYKRLYGKSVKVHLQKDKKIEELEERIRIITEHPIISKFYKGSDNK